MKTGGKDTEGAILEAARRIFLQHGFEGATTQMIADSAGINKALVHYYFRNKDKLFEAVFLEAFAKMIPDILKVFNSDLDLFDKIKKFVDTYITALMNYPQIPMFVMRELHRNPSRIVELFHNSDIRPQQFVLQIQDEIRKGSIRPVDPQQLFVNMMSMCIFPFAARSIIQGFLFGNDTEKYREFLLSRKKEVADFIIQAIKKP